jgi:hypothetical protein
MPRSMARRLVAAALALAAAFAIAACGNKPQIVTEGETEGSYLNVGPMVYQVQISRQLNPRDTEDQTYLQGIVPSEAKLDTGETWFGIFVLVLNESDQDQFAASNFTIEDTQDHIYRPIPQSPRNPFTYHARIVPAGERIPKVDSVASEGVIGGSLLLFKMPLTTLDNRPLEFVVTDQLHHSGRVKLDV